MKTYYAHNGEYFVLDPEAPIIPTSELRKISVDDVSGLVTIQFFGEPIALSEDAWADVAARFEEGRELRADFYAETTLQTTDGDVDVPVSYVDSIMEALRDDTDPHALPIPGALSEDQAEAVIEEVRESFDPHAEAILRREAEVDAELRAEAMEDDGREAAEADAALEAEDQDGE